jgi:hypothetical protein
MSNYSPQNISNQARPTCQLASAPQASLHAHLVTAGPACSPRCHCSDRCTAPHAPLCGLILYEGLMLRPSPLSLLFIETFLTKLLPPLYSPRHHAAPPPNVTADKRLASSIGAAVPRPPPRSQAKSLWCKELLKPLMSSATFSLGC